MKTYSSETVYIMVICAALLLPAGHTQAQLSLPGVNRDLTQRLPDLEVDRQVRSRVENATETVTEVTQTAEEVAAQAAAQADALAAGLVRELVVATDPSGLEIEMNTVVVLVANEQRNALLRPGFEIIAERELPALRMTMITLRKPAGSDLPQAVKQLRSANPAAVVDYNHLYEWTESTAEQSPPAADTDEVSQAPAEVSDLLRIGVIDSAVMQDHRALRELTVIARDFATAPGYRPETHGTAVASLIARSAKQQTEIYSASVFFQLPNRAPGSTAESLVAALDWLVAEQVDAINMSLAGPGNQLLEAAIARLRDLETVVIIAAVGNNGPSGEPLYPAAYDGVIGVTAVDKRNKIFRYANRGEQVAFAARGVNMKVADSRNGGWRLESGTSMASPHVAVVVAQLLRSGMTQARTVESWLIDNSEDLGRRGFDEVYGHGLITQPPIIVSAN